MNVAKAVQLEKIWETGREKVVKHTYSKLIQYRSLTDDAQISGLPEHVNRKVVNMT